MPPKHDLKVIQTIVEDFLKGKSDGIVFSAPSRSLRCVIEIFMCGQQEAEHIISKGIMQLSPNDFSTQLFQWDTVVDVYGLENYKDANWYVKFNLVEDDEMIAVENISFHPIEKPLKLIDGRTIFPKK